MKELGVKATLEFEPFDVAVKDAEAHDFKLPSIDLMRFNAKLEWFVGGIVVELEVSASLSPTIVLGAADRKLLEQFERKVKDLRKEVLDLEGEKKALERAKQSTEGARRAKDAALRRRTELETGLKDVKQEAFQATMQREQADAAVERARKARDKAFRQLDDLKLKDWDAYKKQSKELLDKSGKEITELSRNAASARAHELKLDQSVKSRARQLEVFDKTGEAKRLAKAAEARVKDAERVEKSVARKIERRMARIKGMAREASNIASRGKSWVFKKIVGPRMIKVLGMLTKFIPFVNIISWAADLYEIGKLLWNWDKLKFGIGGGDGGAGGSGSGGKPDPSGKGSGTGTRAPRTRPARAAARARTRGTTRSRLRRRAPARARRRRAASRSPTRPGSRRPARGPSRTGRAPARRRPRVRRSTPHPGEGSPARATTPPARRTRPAAPVDPAASPARARPARAPPAAGRAAPVAAASSRRSGPARRARSRARPGKGLPVGGKPGRQGWQGPGRGRQEEAAAEAQAEVRPAREGDPHRPGRTPTTSTSSRRADARDREVRAA